MTDPLIHLVRLFSQEIQNDRTLRSVFEHGQGEMVELDEEITKVEQGQAEGVDGVVGEAIDVILCKLDLIFQKVPDISDEVILEIAAKKCLKWAEGEKRRAAEAGSDKAA